MVFVDCSYQHVHWSVASVVQSSSWFGTMIVAVHLKLFDPRAVPQIIPRFFVKPEACEELTTPLRWSPNVISCLIEVSAAQSWGCCPYVAPNFGSIFREYNHQKERTKVAWYGFAWLYLRFKTEQSSWFQAAALASDKLQRETLINHRVVLGMYWDAAWR